MNNATNTAFTVLCIALQGIGLDAEISQGGVNVFFNTISGRTTLERFTAEDLDGDRVVSFLNDWRSEKAQAWIAARHASARIPNAD